MWSVVRGMDMRRERTTGGVCVISERRISPCIAPHLHRPSSPPSLSV